MSITAERNKRGKLTGTFIVEVWRNGRMYRRRTRDGALAKEIQKALKEGRDDDLPVFPAAYTVGHLAADVVAADLWADTKDEAQTLARLRASLAILKHGTPLASVRTRELDALVAVLRRRGLGPKTINRYLAPTSKALKWAYARDLIPSLPLVPRQAEPPGRLVFLTEPQAAALVAKLHAQGAPDVGFLTGVLLLTGMRVGELLGLTVDRVEPEWVRLADSKNGDARDLPVPKAVGESLRAMVAAGLPHYRRITRALRTASKALQLPIIVTPHVLRHTTATRLTSNQVPTAIVGQLLGHRSLHTTLKYIHAEKGTLRNAMASLNDHASPVGPTVDFGDSGRKILLPPSYKWLKSKPVGGLGGNRTPVQGFAVLCVTTPPRGPAPVVRSYPRRAALSRAKRLIRRAEGPSGKRRGSRRDRPACPCGR